MKGVCIVIIMFALAAILFFAALCGYAQERVASAIWLNYSVSESGMISLIRPDLPEAQSPANLISVVQLPNACWEEFAEQWEPGITGGIMFGKNWCRVYSRQPFSRGEALQHYRKLHKLAWSWRKTN